MGKLRSNSDICIEEVKSLTAGIADLNLSADGGEWSTKALQRHLLSDRLHHFVGFLDDKPVTMASLNIGDGLSNVDRVKTHKDHREKGYSSALISHLIHYHASVSKNPLYLLADNPIAIHMYKNAGFIDIEHSMTSWTAVKE
jgi:predicted GNAT family acetyltransferase